MSIRTGQDRLIERLVTMPDAPNIKIPEGSGVSLPRYIVQYAGGAQNTDTIDGQTEASPEILVMVETRRDQLTNKSNELIGKLYDRFVPGDSFSGVTIRSVPDVRPPLPSDGDVYRVPVYIRGRYQF